MQVPDWHLLDINLYTNIIVEPTEAFQQKLLQDAQREKGKRTAEATDGEESSKRARTDLGESSQQDAVAGAANIEVNEEPAEVEEAADLIYVQSAEDVLEEAVMDAEEKAWVRKIYEMVEEAGVEGMNERDLKVKRFDCPLMVIFAEPQLLSMPSDPSKSWANSSPATSRSSPQPSANPTTSPSLPPAALPTFATLCAYFLKNGLYRWHHPKSISRQTQWLPSVFRQPAVLQLRRKCTGRRRGCGMI